MFPLISSKGLFSKQGSGSIFLSYGTLSLKKISTLSPLLSEILAVVACRQAEHTQNEDLRNSACSDHCTAKTACAIVQKYLPLALLSDVMRGLAPTPPASTHTPKQGGTTNLQQSKVNNSILAFIYPCFTREKLINAL